MTHTLAIARRDLAERSNVFIAAAVCAVLPFILAVVPGMQTFRHTDVLTTAGGLLSVGFTLGLALLLGATMVGRDLSEKRMSFYFSKPVSAVAIWFGKLIAAFLTIAACFTIIFMPSYLASDVSWRASWNVDLPWGFFIIGTVSIVLLLLAHVLGTMFRSKSALVALDVVLLTAAGFAIAGIVRALLGGLALELLTRVGFTIFGAVVLILIVAGAWQLAKGRADRRQNHVALSRFLWVSMAVVLFVAAAFTAWVVNVSPRDIAVNEIAPAQQGPWVVLQGYGHHRRDYHAAFVYDLATGASQRLPGVMPFRYQSFFSRDGRHLAYAEMTDFRHGIGDLRILPLSANAKPIETNITVGPVIAPVFSDDGTRIALVERGLATVYELASNKSLMSARIDDRGFTRLFFVNNDVVRVYTESSPHAGPKSLEHSINIVELDVRNRRVEHTGTYRVTSKVLAMTVAADGTKALVVDNDQDTMSNGHLIDARTGAILATMPAGSLPHTMLLADGGVAIISTDEAKHASVLDVYGADGAHRQQIALGTMPRYSIGKELRGGELLVTGDDRTYPEQTAVRGTTLVVDYIKGRIVQQSEGIRINSGWERWYANDPRLVVADASQPIPAWGKSMAELYAWTPATGEKKAL